MVSANTHISLRGDVWQARHNAPVPSQLLRQWASHCTALCLPDKVYWCDGSAREREVLREKAQINEGFRVGMAAFMDARHIEIEPAEEGVTDAENSQDLRPLFRGCMRGRTMYVVPFVAKGADGAVVRGLQVTDSPAVAADIEERGIAGEQAWAALARKDPTVLVLHAEGRYAATSETWCFPLEKTVWGYGPGFDTLAALRAMRFDGRWS